MSVIARRSSAVGRGARTTLRLVGVGIGVAGLFVSLALLGGDGIADSVAFHAYVLAGIAIMTIALRSVGLIAAIRAALLSYFLVAAVVWYLGNGAERLFEDSALQRSYLVPVLEETAKLLPVALFLGPLRDRLTWPGLTDLALLGFASGAGFAIHEDALRERVAADGFTWDGWSIVFPTSVHIDDRLVVGHGAWTLLAAVGLGVAWTHRRTWAWALGGVAIGVAIVDHGAVNARGDAYDDLARLLGDGRLVAAAVAAAVIGAVIHDAVVLGRTRRLDDRYQLPRLRPAVDRQLAFRRLLNGAHHDSARTVRLGRTLGDRRPIVARLDDLGRRRSAQ